VATIKVIPAKLNYTLVRGDDFADTVTISEGDPPAPADVSARTYTAQVRSTPDGAVIASMTVDMSNAATGVVGYALEDTVTAGLAGSYVWDFQQDVGGVIRTLMGGSFVVLKDVTRAG
jgi:hypothetical protein